MMVDTHFPANFVDQGLLEFFQHFLSPFSYEIAEGGGRGGVQLSHNKLKSAIFNDKKVYKQKYFSL